MGTISYDGMTVKVDDRTLTHLQIIIVNKLRRGDAFLMSWKDSIGAGSGRSSIWLHPYVLVHFKFDGSRVPSVNEGWLAELGASADSPRGLIVTAEHGGIPDLLLREHAEHVTTMMEASNSEVARGRRLPR